MPTIIQLPLAPSLSNPDSVPVQQTDPSSQTGYSTRHYTLAELFAWIVMGLPGGFLPAYPTDGQEYVLTVQSGVLSWQLITISGGGITIDGQPVTIGGQEITP